MESYNRIQFFGFSLKGILGISVGVVFLKIFDFYKESRRKKKMFFVEKNKDVRDKED